MKKNLFAIRHLLQDSLLKVVRAQERFWFNTPCETQMRAFRTVLGGVLFFYYLTRTPDLELFYSNSGIAQLKHVQEIMSSQFRFSILNYFPGKVALWIAHLSFLVSLASLSFGWWPRISAAIAFGLHISFLHRNMGASYGVDLITTFYLFYLSFAVYDDLSIKRGKSVVGSIAFRLSQIQLCTIYAYSGFGKLAGAQWWKGEAIWDVMANQQLARWDFTWLSHFPFLIVVATYLTIIWEIYFPVLVWVRPMRAPMLIFGIFLHLGIAVALQLPFFALAMVATYVLFLESNTIEKTSGYFRRILQK